MSGKVVDGVWTEDKEESLNTEPPWLRIAGVVVVVIIGVIVAVLVVSSAVTSLTDEEYIPPEIEEVKTGLTMEERDCINLNLIRHYERMPPITQDECDDIYVRLYEVGFVPTPEFPSIPE